LEAIRRQSALFTTKPIFPHFTDHSVSHSDRVADILLRLLSGFQKKESQLTDAELTIGLASCYLHDVAMQSSLGVSKKSVEKLDTDDLLEIRKRHGRIAAQWIIDSIDSSKKGTPEFPRRNLGLDHDGEIRELAPFIAEVCGNHSGEVDLPSKSHLVSHKGSKIRLLFLVHLVRLADALDSDYRRIHLRDLERWVVAPDSLVHWWRHHYVSSIEIDEKATIHVTLRFPPVLTKPYLDFFSAQVISYIDREIQSGRAIFRANDFHPYLEEPTATTDMGQAKEPLRPELAKHISKLMEPDIQNYRSPPRLEVKAETKRDRLVQKWGVIGNPWTDLPAAYGQDEFILTGDIEEKFQELQRLTAQEKGEIRVLFGTRGGGKTTFLNSIKSQYKDTAVTSYHDLGVVLTPIATPQQLYSWLFRRILEDLTNRDFEKEEPTPADFAKAMGEFHIKKPIVLVDNLDRYNQKPDVAMIKRFFELSQGVWQALKKKAVIIISATDEWKVELSSRNLNYIGKASFWNLAKFSPLEVRGLMDNRLRISGSSFGKVFSEDAHKMVHKVSQGNPREALQICSIVYEAAIRESQPIITGEFIQEKFGVELSKRVTAGIVEVSKASGAGRAALESIYGFHLAIERGAAPVDASWDLLLRLFDRPRIPHKAVPDALIHGFHRMADLRSTMVEGREERFWEPRRELRDFARALKEKEISIEEFIQVYRLRPFSPPGLSKERILESFAEFTTRKDINDQLARANDLIASVKTNPESQPLRVLMKARFALEHLLVAFLLASGTPLPGYYMADHQEGIFVNEEGIRKSKSHKRLNVEMSLLVRTVKETSNLFLRTFHEIRIIQNRAREYLRDYGSPPIFNEDDGREIAGAIIKVRDELVEIIRTKVNSGRG
jgi:energy-coupling factor transporter ATP-binding protein EcfA2